MSEIITGLHRWLSLKGRIGRAAYLWQYMVPLSIVRTADRAAGDPAISFLLMIAFIWPTVAGLVKRLHDHDWPTWVGPAFLLVYYVLPWIPSNLVPEAVAEPLRSVWTFSGFALLAFALLIKGTHGPNRYGPDPVSLG